MTAFSPFEYSLFLFSSDFFGDYSIGGSAVQFSPWRPSSCSRVPITTGWDWPNAAPISASTAPRAAAPEFIWPNPTATNENWIRNGRLRTATAATDGRIMAQGYAGWKCLHGRDGTNMATANCLGQGRLKFTYWEVHNDQPEKCLPY
jgi:hypothetical protein